MKKNSMQLCESNVPGDVVSHPAWIRLNEQLTWYDERSRSNQRRFKWLTSTKFVLAALIPLVALSPEDLLPPIDTNLCVAILGSAIAVIEGSLQINQNASVWVQYRKTAEHLKHERWLFLARSGPYRDLASPESLLRLAERVEEHVSTEHATWVTQTRSAMTAGNNSVAAQSG